MTDRDFTRHLERSKQSKDIPLPSLPGYAEWSARYQDRYPVAIEWMDEQCTWMHPDEVAGDHTELFEELFADIRAQLGEQPGDNKAIERVQEKREFGKSVTPNCCLRSA